MKTLLLALMTIVLTRSLAGSASGAVPTKPPKEQPAGNHYPMPPYPYQARQRGLAGDGVCQVSFDSSGHPLKATMTKSTGSDLLDGNTVNFARANWKGRPNSVANVPVSYKLVGSIPIPAKGSGLVRVTFDGSGHVANIIVVKSVGSARLDQNTLDFGKANWTGPPTPLAIFRLPTNVEVTRSSFQRRRGQGGRPLGRGRVLGHGF